MYVVNLLMSGFATHGLNTGLFGVLKGKHIAIKSMYHFATQTALRAGLNSRFPETGLRNLLPRKGTRTRSLPVR